MDSFHYRQDIDHGHDLMCCSPGVTEPNLTAEPLGTEGEMTPGPDHINPFRSERERRIVEEIEAHERAHLRREDPVDEDFRDTIGLEPLGHPTEGDDPFVFDDVEDVVDDVQLPSLDRGPTRHNLFR